MDKVMLLMQGLTLGVPIGFMLGIMLFTWDPRKPTRYKARTAYRKAFGIV